MADDTLDRFCGSVFWDSNVTWYTEDPDLTPCFQKTVLIWVPCAFLWGFAPLETYYILHSKTRNIPWNWLNITKLILNALLIVLCAVDIGFVTNQSSHKYGASSADHYAPVVKLLSFALAAAFVVYNRSRGLRTSGLLFLFWLLLAIFGIPQFRTEIQNNSRNNDGPLYPFVSYMIYYAVVLALLVLNGFADSPPRFSEHPPDENPCPEQSASFLSKMFFSWFDGLALAGYRKPLEMKDLWNINPEDTCREIIPVFDKHWEKSRQKAENVQSPKASFSKRSASVDFVSGKHKKKKLASVLPAICKAFGPTFLFGALLKLIQDLLMFVSPQLLKLLIQFVQGDEPNWKGHFYAVLLLATAAIQTIVLAQYFNRMFIVGLRIRTALISAIYRKALKMSNSARKESTVGEIVNLMSVDAQRFMDLTSYLNMIWSAPLQISLALIFLWEILGPSVLAGLLVMIVLIPLNGFIASRAKKLQIKQMKYKDERVKLMNEILSGMKVLKLYAWEPSFERQILDIREKEVHVLKQSAYLNAGTSFIWSCAPFLVSLITFTTYILSSSDHVLDAEKAFVALALFNIMRMPFTMLPGLIVAVAQVSLVTFAVFVLTKEDNVLDAQTAFVSLSLFNILRFPLSMLPMLISNMVQASVSIKRMNKYMNSEELDPNNVTHEPAEKEPLVIENGTFTWDAEDPPCLKGINLKIKYGSLVAVVGTVGSGKSSLISAFLGEMEKLTGRVNTKGSIAYVPQQAWIQNNMLRDNIVFGKSLDHALYTKVVEACALKPDFEMLPAGDQTEIGEKGINLSGGQKQRVSLARAVYNNADVYLMDDPLSAVDSHVGKHIFENVIGPSGMLKKKTRVLVTHGITFLPEVDHIIVLKDGEVSEQGTYKELLEKKSAFAEFLVQHLQEITEDDGLNAELDDLKEQLESSLPIESNLRAKLEKAISRVSESHSDTASQEDRRSRSGSFQRQHSVESSNSVKPANSDSMKKLNSEKEPIKGEKLIEAEKAEVGSVKLRVYAHYLRSIGLLFSFLTLLFNGTFQGFSIGSNVWLAVWSDNQYGQDIPVSNVSSNGTTTTRTNPQELYLGVYGALGFGQAIASYLADLSPQLGCWVAAVALHNTLLKGVLHAPLEFFDVTPIGRILSRFSQDTDAVDEELNYYMSDCVFCLFEVVATLFVISYTTPIFIAVIIPVAIIYYIIQRFYVATSRQLKRLESISKSPIYSHFGESITGSSTIRAYSVQERFIKESEEKVDINQVCYYPGIISNRWLAVRLEMIGNMIIFFSALFAVLGRDTMNPGLVGLTISYALQITQTLNWLVRMTSDVETNIVAVERIKEYAEHSQEAPWENPSNPVPKDWPSEGTVEFKNYQVRYREGLDLVLKGISFTVNGGEKVGIVGRTGAGKSSLTLGLFRIIEPAGGSILIDNIDVSKLGLHALRSRLTIIPQDPVLFSGTLRINLDPFNTHNDDAIWTALEQAHLKLFVKGLAAGLNHAVSEGGENLSVGQRQLICLARALLRKTKVLILDEATAAVDLETDDLIQRTIKTEFKSCTVLTIAHRLNTIMDSDRVIVLDKGQIVEFDTPSKLLQNKNSVFYGMAKDAGLV